MNSNSSSDDFFRTFGSEPESKPRERVGLGEKFATKGRVAIENDFETGTFRISNILDRVDSLVSQYL